MAERYIKKRKRGCLFLKIALVVLSGALTLYMAQKMTQKCPSWVAGQHSCDCQWDHSIWLIWFCTWKCRILAQSRGIQFIDFLMSVWPWLMWSVLSPLYFISHTIPTKHRTWALPMGSAALAILGSLSEGAERGPALWSFCLQWVRFTMNNSLDRFLPL